MPTSSARPSRPAAARSLRPVLVVQGFADLQGNVSVTKIAEYWRPPRPVPSNSHFEVVVHAPGGTILGRQPMETVPGIAHNLPGTVAFLSAEIPASGAAAIEIFRDGNLVAPRAERVWALGA